MYLYSFLAFHLELAAFSKLKKQQQTQTNKQTYNNKKGILDAWWCVSELVWGVHECACVSGFVYRIM